MPAAMVKYQLFDRARSGLSEGPGDDNGAAASVMRPSGTRRGVEQPPRRLHRIARQAQILGQHVAGAEGQHAHRNLGSRNPLNHVEDGAVAAADQDGVESLRHALPGLLAGRLRRQRLHRLDRAARRAQQRDDAGDAIAVHPPLLKDRIHKQQNAMHPCVSIQTPRNRSMYAARFLRRRTIVLHGLGGFGAPHASP
jgi:hypothetical protein